MTGIVEGRVGKGYRLQDRKRVGGEIGDKDGKKEERREGLQYSVVVTAVVGYLYTGEL